MADDFSKYTLPGLENLSGINNIFNFNVFENTDWSPFEKFMSDPHNWGRESAKLDAALNANPLFKMSQDEQTTFFQDFAAGKQEAIDKDIEMSKVIEEAKSNAAKTYNQYYGIKEDSGADTSGSSTTSGPSATSNPTITPIVPKTTTNISNIVTTSNPPPPVTPTPKAPSPVQSVSAKPTKTAPIDTILYPSDDQLPVEIMADLIFENIGGQELINIARNDTVNGQQVVYQPIKNLTQIQQQYNPNNIVSLQATSDKYFQNFSIKLDNKVPEEGNGPGGAHVYIDPQTGDLVIEAINLAADEQIEVEITTSGTIYEAEL